ncbi:unnamed protein product [Rotaria magnacalcarata]|uniref:Alpha/beta hydrolase fold-3 domain-containing protein n=2 Tax=Rotaria magnacalcarata TaxID=392030 RepID=A0A817A5M4_9BILA|nr:unnamed protein product [Rotaria magnacalcarata]CAF4241310.1 unnamed protein product [Rotaria magnacalcarata]
MVFIQPFINYRTLYFSQSARITALQTTFMARIWALSLFQPLPVLSPASDALIEIMRLHHPPLFLSPSPDRTQLREYRSTAKKIFKTLYPQRNKQTCKIEPIVYEYNNRQVHAYSIKEGDMNDWTDTSQDFLLYIHGGGFVSGDIDTYAGYECYLSKEYHMPVIHIEYRLSPESTLLSSINEVVAVYMSMLEFDRNITQRMIGMGDSSGGLMWLRLIQMMVEEQQPVPLGLVLLSPWVDLSFMDIELDSDARENRVLLSLQLALNLREQILDIDKNFKGPTYFEEFIKQLNEVNPIAHSFEGLPPVYVTVGTEELFYCDALMLEQKILASNREIILDKGYGLMHAYPMYHRWSPEAACAQNKIRTFIEEL